MATPDVDPSNYAFAQAKQAFEDARANKVPAGYEEYVESSKGEDKIKIWRKFDSPVRSLLFLVFYASFYWANA